MKDKIKVKQVAKEYVKNGLNMTKALKTVEKLPIKHESYEVKAVRWRDDPLVMETIREELAKFDDSVVNDQYIYNRLLRLVESDDIKFCKASDRINALSLMAKCLGLAREGNTSQNIAVFTENLDKLKSQLNKLDRGKLKSVDDSSIEPINNNQDATNNNVTIEDTTINENNNKLT